MGNFTGLALFTGTLITTLSGIIILRMFWREIKEDHHKKNNELEVEQQIKTLLESVREKSNFMYRHLLEVKKLRDNIERSQLETKYKDLFLSEYETYLGLYEKIKTYQIMTKEDSIEFSRLYVSFTNIIIMNRIKGQDISEQEKQLFTVNLN